MTIKGIAAMCLFLVLVALAAANAPDLFSGMSAGGGVVIVPPATQGVSVPSIYITGTVNAQIQNTIGVVVWPSIAISVGSIAFVPTAIQNVIQVGTPLATQPVSVPTVGVMIWPSPPVAPATVWVGNSTGSPVPVGTIPGVVATVQANVREQATIGVMVWPSPPAAVGTVWVANSPGVNVQNTVPVSFPTSTLPVSLPTIGVQMFNTPAVQGSVSINNTPDVLFNDRVTGTPIATTTASANFIDCNTHGSGQLRFAVNGTYTGSLTFQSDVSGETLAAVQVYPLTNGLPAGAPTTGISCAGTCTNDFVALTSGAHAVRVLMNSFTSGSANVLCETGQGNPFHFIVNTPAIQGSVSINNTPAVQGSVSINNTPAVQGSVSINNTPMVIQPTTNPCLNPQILPTSLPINIAASATAIVATPAAANRLIICDINYSNGAAANVQWVAASATASAICPSPAALTGAMVGNVNINGEPAFSLGTGQKLCAWPVGTAINVQGVVSYVQQP